MDLSLTVSGGREAREAIGRIPLAAQRAGQKAVDKAALAFEREVKRGYRSGDHTPLAPSTLQKRKQGKRRGATPAIPVYRGSRPLYRSGRLIELIERRSKRTRTTYELGIGIRRGVRMPGGGLSDRVALVHEQGRTFTVTASSRARTYLRALALGVAGTADAVASPGPGSISITVRIPARPVWGPAFAKVAGSGGQQFRAVFGAAMKQELNFVARGKR